MVRNQIPFLALTKYVFVKDPAFIKDEESLGVFYHCRLWRKLATMMPPIPFYATKSAQPPSKRLIIISYHFPPSGTVGGLRWQKLARFLVADGWGVDVVCLDPSSLRLKDPTRLLDLPDEVRLYGVPETSSISHHLLTYISQQYSSYMTKRRPDGQAGSIHRDSIDQNTDRMHRIGRAWWSYASFSHMKRWADHAAKLALRIVNSYHRIVITSGPPHMVHYVGTRIAKRYNIPHVIDMRDPWSLEERVSRTLASPVYFHLAAKHERRLFECASLILSTTELATKSLRDFYPALSGRFVTIMNGCDDEPLPLPKRKPTFVIAYAGEIYMDRDPRLLFRAVGRVVRDLKLTPEHIFLRFIGGVESLDGASLYTMADQEGIRSHISLGRRRPREETLKFLADAKMLVLLPQDSYTAIPAKLFEYLRFPSWVLALAEEDSATGLLLKGSGADLVRPDDVEHMVDVIRRRYLEHADGVEPTPIAEQGNFNRQRQAKMLLRYLDSLTSPA